jgi:hypothetical protein
MIRNAEIPDGNLIYIKYVIQYVKNIYPLLKYGIMRHIRMHTHAFFLKRAAPPETARFKNFQNIFLTGSVALRAHLRQILFLPVVLRVHLRRRRFPKG